LWPVVFGVQIPRAAAQARLRTARNGNAEKGGECWFSRPYGTELLFSAFPALKRWAIVATPLRGWLTLVAGFGAFRGLQLETD